MSDQLTPKQEAFCLAYVKDPETKYNGTQSVIKAGYSENGASVQASQLLANTKVRARVQQLQDEATEALGITHEYILGGLKNIADNADKDSDKVRAFDLLGKNKGMWVEKVEHGGEVKGSMSVLVLPSNGRDD